VSVARLDYERRKSSASAAATIEIVTRMIDWSRCQDVESVPDRCHGAPVVKGTRIMVQRILDNAEAGCSAEEIAREIYDLDLEVVRRVLRFARLAEAASLLQRAETIMHHIWQDESDRAELAPDILDMLQQTATEIEQAAGTLAQVTYQPDADDTAL
jgi:uncharacterized protein (DUF433 family)